MVSCQPLVDEPFVFIGKFQATPFFAQPNGEERRTLLRDGQSAVEDSAQRGKDAARSFL